MNTTYVYLKDAGYSKTFTINLLFSIEDRRFIEPFQHKHLCAWYYVQPGKIYLLFTKGGWKLDPERQWTIAKLVSFNENKEMTQYGTLDLSIVDVENELIKDIMKVSVYDCPRVDYTKTYNEKDVQWLISEIKKAYEEEKKKKAEFLKKLDERLEMLKKERR